MNSIYQEIVETLDAIAADLSDEGYTDYDEPETMGFIADEFNAVWEDR